MTDYARLYPAMTDYTRLYPTITEYARLYPTMPDYDRLYPGAGPDSGGIAHGKCGRAPEFGRFLPQFGRWARFGVHGAHVLLGAG